MHRYTHFVSTQSPSAWPTLTAETPPGHRPPSSLHTGPDRPFSPRVPAHSDSSRVSQHLRAVCNRVSPWSAPLREPNGPPTSRPGPGLRGNGPVPPHGSSRGGSTPDPLRSEPPSSPVHCGPLGPLLSLRCPTGRRAPNRHKYTARGGRHQSTRGLRSPTSRRLSSRYRLRNPRPPTRQRPDEFTRRSSPACQAPQFSGRIFLQCRRAPAGPCFSCTSTHGWTLSDPAAHFHRPAPGERLLPGLLVSHTVPPMRPGLHAGQ